MSTLTSSVESDKPKIKVVIVEDAPTDRFMLARYLQQDNDCTYVCLEASYGAEGLELCRLVKPDCVLLDYGLPDMSGADFVAAVQGAHGMLPFPIIMISGQAGAKLARETYQCGAADLLLKDTLTGGELRNAIKEVLCVRAGRDLAAQPVVRVGLPTGATAKARPALDLEGVCALVVDDSPDNRFLISRFLTIAGATTAEAPDGQQAIHAALERRFDVIIMDVQMPLIDGYEATRQLRSAGCQTPIIALSGHSGPEHLRLVLEAGCTDHLSKPIDRALLLKTIDKHVRGTAHA